jgi:hypothetical protein
LLADEKRSQGFLTDIGNLYDKDMAVPSISSSSNGEIVVHRAIVSSFLVRERRNTRVAIESRFQIPHVEQSEMQATTSSSSPSGESAPPRKRLKLKVRSTRFLFIFTLV